MEEGGGNPMKFCQALSGVKNAVEKTECTVPKEKMVGHLCLKLCFCLSGSKALWVIKVWSRGTLSEVYLICFLLRAGVY